MLAASLAAEPAPTPTARPPTPAVSAGATAIAVQSYAPGVRIDWGRRAVAVDARVVLRKGLLELFACSPNTREHESILVVPARPLRIHEALGLVGLEPGRPPGYDGQRGQGIAASGGALRVVVQYVRDGVEWTAAAEEWVIDRTSNRSPSTLDFVFAGSRSLDGGSFGADSEGTVICLVDFDTALVAVGSSHSADNEQLWLAANTDAIPPVGTTCTMVIRAADYACAVIALTVVPGGVLREGDRVVAPDAVARKLRAAAMGGQHETLVLRSASDATVADVRSALNALTGAGVDPRFVEVRPPQAKRTEKPSSTPGG